MTHVLVTGAVGSGKTHLSGRLGPLLRRKVISLDALYFDLAAKEHRKVRELPERLQLLEERLAIPTLFEGWHFGPWLVPLYRQLSCVVIVDTPLPLREQRIAERFARRKVGLESNPFPMADEQHLQNLLKWTRLFSRETAEEEIRRHCPPTCGFYTDDGFGSVLSQVNSDIL